jgi:hypothetical protein
MLEMTTLTPERKSSETASIAAIGECMLELSADNRPGNPGVRPMNLSFGGDTLKRPGATVYWAGDSSIHTI